MSHIRQNLLNIYYFLSFTFKKYTFIAQIGIIAENFIVPNLYLIILLLMKKKATNTRFDA